ncbi:MAG: hypothetical protein K2H56_03755 [Malacoplasma sp.]|nr:hypothetical protein [Malacoplasma sp.]
MKNNSVEKKSLNKKSYSVKEFLSFIKNDLRNSKTVEVFSYNKNIIEEYDDLEKEEHILIYESECLFKFKSIETIKIVTDEDMTKEVLDQLKLINSHLVEIDGKLEKIETRLENVEQRLYKVEQRLDKVEQRLDKVEQRLDKVEQRIDKVEQRLDKVEQRLDVLETDVKILKDDVSAIKRCPTIQKELCLIK